MRKKTAPNAAVPAISLPLPPTVKRVLLMVSMEHAHGRRILDGIADYADHHTRWQNVLELEIDPRPVRRGGVDGMIIEARDGRVARAVREHARAFGRALARAAPRARTGI